MTEQLENEQLEEQSPQEQPLREQAEENSADDGSAHDVQNSNMLENANPSPIPVALPEGDGSNPVPFPASLALENALAELEAERALRRRGECKLACIALLEEHSLPISLCDYLTGDSIEETQMRVNEVSKIVRDAISEEVKRRLATVPTPCESPCTMSRSEFKALSLADMQRLYVTDKELYNQLSKNF